MPHPHLYSCDLLADTATELVEPEDAILEGLRERAGTPAEHSSQSLVRTARPG
jgi:hypothetical protein